MRILYGLNDNVTLSQICYFMEYTIIGFTLHERHDVYIINLDSGKLLKSDIPYVYIWFTPIPYATMSEKCDECGGLFWMADTDDAQNRWYKTCVACGHRQRELTTENTPIDYPQ